MPVSITSTVVPAGGVAAETALTATDRDMKRSRILRKVFFIPF
jgi:hypothetical protein